VVTIEVLFSPLLRSKALNRLWKGGEGEKEGGGKGDERGYPFYHEGPCCRKEKEKKKEPPIRSASVISTINARPRGGGKKGEESRLPSLLNHFFPRDSDRDEGGEGCSRPAL